MNQNSYLYSNLDQLFASQIDKALNNFPLIEINHNFSLNTLQAECFIIALNTSKINQLNIFDTLSNQYLDDFLNNENFNEAENGKIFSIKMKIESTFKRIFVIKINDNENLANHSTFIENCFKKITIEIKKQKFNKIGISFDTNFNSEKILSSLHGIVFSNFYFTLKNIDKPQSELSHIDHIYISTSHEEINKCIPELKALCESVNLTKVWSNGPTNLINPDSWAEFIKNDMQQFKKITTKILDEQQMEKLGMNALLGVGSGSKYNSKLILIEYCGQSENFETDQPICFVGKGVTFDTGGLSIKTGNYMEGMKYDKSGAASALGAIRSLAGRNAKINALAVLAVVENAVSENSQRPDDIVMSMSGQTIDIRNTDAEGRLILADALTYAQRFYKPKLIIDLATLTGAMAIALGSNLYGGLFSNNDNLCEQLTKAGSKTNEKLWRMPLDPEYNKKMDSKVADMQNTSNTPGFGGGSITAAEFLQRFIEKDTIWAHLDIANVDNFSSNTPNHFYGSTAFGVRLLNEFTKQYEN